MIQKRQRKNADINSKVVFKDPLLFSQFLRDNITEIPQFQNVQPEDIEDMTERYTSYFGLEFDADTVNRVRIWEDGLESELYVIALVEHKSFVDYNVIMQILKYMVCIWIDFEKGLNNKERNKIHNKDFRYPLVLPIVYYEGKESWTADIHLTNRIVMGELFKKYLPDFTYLLVKNHEITNEELLERNDEMSLIMLLNKIQTAEDLKAFLSIPSEKFDELLQNASDQIIDIMVSVINSVCRSINATEQETKKCVDAVRNRNMGCFFENAEKMDIQAERRKTEEAREERDAVCRELMNVREERDHALEKLAKVEQEIKQLREKNLP